VSSAKSQPLYTKQQGVMFRLRHMAQNIPADLPDLDAIAIGLFEGEHGELTQGSGYCQVNKLLLELPDLASRRTGPQTAPADRQAREARGRDTL
jgi:hypothetical protein